MIFPSAHVHYRSKASVVDLLWHSFSYSRVHKSMTPNNPDKQSQHFNPPTKIETQCHFKTHHRCGNFSIGLLG